MEPIELPIEDVLDLHTFLPQEVPNLLDDYLSACIEKQIYSVRIIHGKGQGILKKRVEKYLFKNHQVRSFKSAPPEAGGWGATLVELNRTDAC